MISQATRVSRAVTPEEEGTPRRIRNRLFALSIILFICGIATLASGTHTYVSHPSDNESLTCNYGASGIVALVFAPLTALPYFFPGKKLLVTTTALAGILCGILFVLWIVLAYTPGYYGFRNAKAGYYLNADSFFNRIVDGSCYNGGDGNQVSDHCTCAANVSPGNPSTIDWRYFCNPDCSMTQKGIWAVWAFLFISFWVALAISIIGCCNGGCIIWKRNNDSSRGEEMDDSVPTAYPVNVASDQSVMTALPVSFEKR